MGTEVAGGIEKSMARSVSVFDTDCVVTGGVNSGCVVTGCELLSVLGSCWGDSNPTVSAGVDLVVRGDSVSALVATALSDIEGSLVVGVAVATFRVFISSGPFLAGGTGVSSATTVGVVGGCIVVRLAATPVAFCLPLIRELSHGAVEPKAPSV